MLKGISLKVASTLVFAAMAALIKALSATVSVSEIVLFRSLFSLLTLLIWLAQRGELPGALATRRPLGHVGRSVAGATSMFGNFLAIETKKLGEKPRADQEVFLQGIRDRGGIGLCVHSLRELEEQMRPFLL